MVVSQIHVLFVVFVCGFLQTTVTRRLPAIRKCITMNAVTCLTWVRRGVAKAHPELVRLPDDELENLLSSAGRGAAETDSSSDQFDSDDEKQRKTAKRGNLHEAKDSVEMRYHLDDYDDEDGGTENEEAGLGKLSFYTSNRHDPYLSKDDQSSDNESDLSVSPGDNLIALGKVHGEFFSLEVWVTNVDDGSVYCHHDVILSSCPLAMEWVGFDPGESDSSSANLVAVGSMTPSIELWDLDVVNTLEPVFTLKSKQRCRRKEKAAKKVCLFVLFYFIFILSVCKNWATRCCQSDVQIPCGPVDATAAHNLLFH